MIPRRLQLPKIVPKAKENAAHFFYGGVEQFNGREGETATLFGRCPLNFNGLDGGFARVISAVVPLRRADRVLIFQEEKR